MKTKLLSMCMVLCVFLMGAQQPYVATPTIIPQNPSTTSIIKVLTKVTTANQGIIVDNNTHTVTGLQIKIKGCYWQGMLTATQDYIDTLNIGQLPPGNYQILQKAFLSSTQQHCSSIDSNVVAIQFQVSQVTSLNERYFDQAIFLYPNPSSDKISMNGISHEVELCVYSLRGELLKKELHFTGELDVSDLPNSLYLLKITEEVKNKQQFLKFIKSTGTN